MEIFVNEQSPLILISYDELDPNKSNFWIHLFPSRFTSSQGAMGEIFAEFNEPSNDLFFEFTL